VDRFARVKEKMYLTHKAKIQTDEQTERILNHLCFSATKVYNTVLYNLRKPYEGWKKMLNYCEEIDYPFDLQPPKTNRNRVDLQTEYKSNHWAKNLHSQSTQYVIKEVIDSYKSFFALRQKGHIDAMPPGFRPKHSLSPVTYLQKAFTITECKSHFHLRLSCGNKRGPDGIREITLPITLRTDIDPTTAKVVKLTYDTVSGNYLAHLVCSVNVPPTQSLLFPNVVAVDLGLNNIVTAVSTEGDSMIISGREIKATKRYWQKVRSKVKPPSALMRKPSRRYQQVQRKESRQVNHRLHIISKSFVQFCEDKQVDTIVIGDLTGIRDHIDYGKRNNQQLHSWNFGKVADFIEYKAKLIGIETVTLSEKYTSQTCSACGTVKKSNRKTRGLYICACGHRINADVLGASNILTKYLRQRSSGSVALPVATLVHARTNAHCLRTINQHPVGQHS
jgi:putative transposase